MQLITSLFTAAVALPALATARVAARQATSVTPGFCTTATYSADDPYPYGFPIGTGFCAGVTSTLGTCYNWASFPDDSALINNLTWVYVPPPYICTLYKNDACEGTGANAEYGTSDLSNPELFGDVTYNDAVNSWKCFSS